MSEHSDEVRYERFCDDCSGVTITRHECGTCQHFTPPSFGNRSVCAIYGSDMRLEDKDVCKSYLPVPEWWKKKRR